jgi:ketosteroid isomerase-like protein
MRATFFVLCALSAAPAQTSSDSARVASTLEAFHGALARADSAMALRLLAPEAVILEAGDTETVAQYRAHHLSSDIEYARAVPRRLTSLRVTVHGDVAWARSTSESQGTFRDRAVDSLGAELAVLRRGDDGTWRIVAIQWSSRSRPRR